ncbi:Myb/SANT-like domain-containing protein [Tanacetum coccineum]
MERSRSRSRKKCFWAESETQLLIEVLQDMACDPSWKTDTGFRRNYMCKVHRRILVKRPSFSKKVSPHIESKVKWLKTKFHAINDMLKQSGCSWNDIDKKIAANSGCGTHITQRCVGDDTRQQCGECGVREVLERRYNESFFAMGFVTTLAVTRGCCLTSWFSKKQTALAISTTEAEYVSIGKACQQALWMKQALINYDI